MTLTERERFIHYYTALTVGGIIQHACPDCVGEMLTGVLNKRCKKLTETEANEVLADFRDETVGGCNIMGDIIQDLLSIDNKGSAWTPGGGNRS